MTWRRIVAAAVGHPKTLDWLVCRGSCNDVDILATLLLLDDAPHPAAALAAAATAPNRSAPLVHAALAPHVAPALAAWCTDPQWANRAIGDVVTKRWFAWGVAVLSGALRNDPAVLHDAGVVVLRADDPWCVGICLNALGAAGWAALTDDLRPTLLTRAPAADNGWVWAALDDAQRAAATERAESSADDAARLIGAIGAAAWTATDPSLRERLIAAAVHSPASIPCTAPAWPGMTDDERDALATAAMACDNAVASFDLLDALGGAGRATLTVEQRAALETRGAARAAWRMLTLRAADDGWGALPSQARRAVLAATRRSAAQASAILRAVGAAGWNAMTADERARIAEGVRRAPDALFACPPTLWDALAGAALPPTHQIRRRDIKQWRAEDADADLGGLPPSHQAAVLALAPWRPEDATAGASRMQRLCAAWDALTEDERAALALAHPRVLAAVAAAARLGGGRARALDAVGATVAQVVTATGAAADKRAVGAMLRTPAHWRAWMGAYAPTDGDPSETWSAWQRAARRGVVPDSAICARLAAKEWDAGAPARPVRRTGRRRGGRAASS